VKGFVLGRRETIVVDGVMWTLFGYSRRSSAVVMELGISPVRPLRHTIVSAITEGGREVLFDVTDGEPTTERDLVAKVRAALAEGA